MAADPEFPWTYLALAYLYAQPQFKDEPKQTAAYERFFSLCPAPLDSEAYRDYDRWPKHLRLKTAAGLRERLRNASEPRELILLPKLWALEFQQPPAEHVAVRERVSADLAILRKSAANHVGLLRAALEGYGLLDDREGARWARERIAELLPHSFTAASIAIERWYGDRRRPTEEDSRERVQGYYRELLTATDDWIGKWPLNEDVWISRFRALRELPEESPQKLLEAGDGFMRASAANPETYGVPPSLMVATAFQRRGIGADRIAPLIARNERDTSARLAADAKTNSIPESWNRDNREKAQEDYAEARLLLVKSGTTEERRRALVELEEHARRLASEEGLWRIEPKLATAYVVSGNADPAKAILAKLGTWLDSNKPSKDAPRAKVFQYAQRRAAHAKLNAAIAELEKRPRGAAEAYQRLLDSRPAWETLDERFATIDKAKALWERGAGDPEAWNKWWVVYSGTASGAATRWDSVERAIPEFSLADLTGRTWSRADLNGKTVLVNFWATWCAPCVAELPYIQKLHTALRDRGDALVLTFNVDENPGVIKPFLERIGATTVPVLPAYDFVFRQLQINGFPRTWIVYPDGVVRREQVGFTSQPEQWLQSVMELLTKRP